MRILILEDDLLTAMELRDLVEDRGHDVKMCETVAGARRAISDPPDFAFLDIDLPDGKSFEVAACLEAAHVPFAFVSGSVQADVPADLRHAPFIPKPFAHAAILASLGERRAAA